VKRVRLASFQIQTLVTVTAILTTSSCNLVSSTGQRATSGSEDIKSANLGKQELNIKASQHCTNSKRLLNPIAESISPESNQVRYFRLAYSYAIEGDFNEAVLKYHQAAELSNCDCDRLHAEAGEKAAKEAKEIFSKEGITARPTQFFWGRLQELTQTLPCVEKR
jgi:hypothetical protein